MCVSQASLEENRDLIDGITGFEESVRKCKLIIYYIYLVLLNSRP